MTEPITKKEVLEMIKAVMPNRGFIYKSAEEVVEEIWENIDELESNEP